MLSAKAEELLLPMRHGYSPLDVNPVFICYRVIIIIIIIINTNITIIIILSLLSQQLLLMAGCVFYARPLFQLKAKNCFDATNH